MARVVLILNCFVPLADEDEDDEDEFAPPPPPAALEGEELDLLLLDVEEGERFGVDDVLDDGVDFVSFLVSDDEDDFVDFDLAPSAPADDDDDGCFEVPLTLARFFTGVLTSATFVVSVVFPLLLLLVVSLVLLPVPLLSDWTSRECFF